MIVTEQHGDLTRTYSNAGFCIRKVSTGEVYDEAWDVQDFQYEETDILLPPTFVPVQEQLAELHETQEIILDILEG